MANRCLLYYITDRGQFRGDESARRISLLARIAEAVRSGVNYIQLREKDLSTRELEMLARDVVFTMRNSDPLKTESRQLRTRLMINSRADIALAAGADGVHLRSDDVAAHEVRHLLEVVHRPQNAEDFLVAASCHSAADIQRAESDKVDFAVFAPVFGKSGTTPTPTAGVAALREACKERIPVLGLGGVTLENAALCLKAGAAGIAGIRLFQENKIEDVVRALQSL